MTGDGAAGPSEIHHLHTIVEAELEQAGAGEDPPGEDEAELQQFLVRMRGLRDAVVAMETYEDGLGEA
jgi:hypothetical protein